MSAEQFSADEQAYEAGWSAMHWKTQHDEQKRRADLLAESVDRLAAERDQYKQIAELNAETIRNIQHERDAAHAELVHRMNSPGSY